MMGRRRGEQRLLFYEVHINHRVLKSTCCGRIDVFMTAAMSMRSISSGPFDRRRGRWLTSMSA
jgi:hypothetical protein